MPFNTLLTKCLLPDQTSYVDQGTGLGVKIDKQQGETILFFAIDDDDNPFLSDFGLKNKCDLLIFYSGKEQEKTISSKSRGKGKRKKHEKPKTEIIEAKTAICLVELKGSDFKHATKQILAVHKIFQGKHIFQKDDFHAVIIMTGSVPSAADKRTLKNAFGENVLIKGGIPKGKCFDIGDYIRS